MSYGICEVIGCRFKNDHVTKRHCCGICKHNGHGQNECKNQELLLKLEKNKGDFIRNFCTIPECIDSYTHTTKGHSCLYCDKRGANNHLICCPNNKTTNFCNNICDDISNYDDLLKENIKEINVNINEYKITSAGMGCTWLIRNNNDNYEYLFMHSDNWGQYGEDSSDVPRYKAFIYGYNLVE